MPLRLAVTGFDGEWSLKGGQSHVLTADWGMLARAGKVGISASGMEEGKSVLDGGTVTPGPALPWAGVALSLAELQMGGTRQELS